MLHRWGNLVLVAALSLSGLISPLETQAQQSEPFKLEAETKDFLQQPTPSYPSYPSYPTYPQKPQMQPQTPRAATPPPPRRPIQASVQQNQQNQQNQQRPLQASVVAPGVLPNEFLGVWQVAGNRQSVDAQPQYQQGINGIFSQNTGNIWQIQGSPQQGYTLTTDTGVSTQLVVDKVQGGTAYLRYQHQIRNTVAQEAIVMMLGSGGAQFSGLERISIVKQGEPQPRAKVTYQLAGRRQR